MNRLWRFLRGYWDLELTGASPDWVLNRLTQQRIPVWNICRLDAFTVRISVFPRDIPAVKAQAEKAMCQVEDAEAQGFGELLRGIWSRPVLCLGLLAGFLMMLLLPRFVLFYTVEGNKQVPSKMILRNLDTLGVGVGVYGPNIHNQWVEDHMLNLVAELERIAINQSGCKAQVLVRERPETPQVMDRKGFSNIVADRAAIILEQNVWTGQPLKQPGDVVAEGELLVSGVVDLERTFLLTRAQAEIFGQTWREYDAVTPELYAAKTVVLDTSTAVWIEVGKRRIKIFGNSGISTAACDKMISRKILSLPGGHLLPVSILAETCILRGRNTERSTEVEAQTLLAASVAEMAAEQMRAGQILKQRQTLSAAENLWTMHVWLECREMIARVAEANWIEEEYAYD